MKKEKTFLLNKYKLKSCTRETLNLSMCADSSSDTIKNQNTKKKKTKGFKCKESSVTCHV